MTYDYVCGDTINSLHLDGTHWQNAMTVKDNAR